MGRTTVTWSAGVALAGALLLGSGLACAGSDGGGDPSEAPSDEAGDLTVREAWAAPSTDVAAVYLRIDNGGDDDRLVRVASDPAASVSVMDESAGGAGAHTGAGAGGTGGAVDLAVPSGLTELSPGRGHLMLSDLVDPLEPGDPVDLVLDFAGAGRRRVPVEIVGWDEAVDRYEQAEDAAAEP